MSSIKTISGAMLPLELNDIDTDQLATSDTMKFSERVDLSDYLFMDWRLNPDFIMNDPAYAKAKIILAGENFGCGSSREHAPWALMDYGFKTVVARSFGDIFRSNCAKLGLLLIQLEKDPLDMLIQAAKSDPSVELIIDIESQCLRCGNLRFSFSMDSIIRDKFLHGLTDIDLIHRYDDQIAQYERKAKTYLVNL